MCKLIWNDFVTPSIYFSYNLGFEHKEDRLKEMRSAILDTFPEPNRKLLQRYYLFSFFNMYDALILKSSKSFYIDALI